MQEQLFNLLDYALIGIRVSLNNAETVIQSARLGIDWNKSKFK